MNHLQKALSLQGGHKQFHYLILCLFWLGMTIPINNLSAQSCTCSFANPLVDEHFNEGANCIPPQVDAFDPSLDWQGCPGFNALPLDLTKAKFVSSYHTTWSGVDHTTNDSAGNSWFLVLDGPSSGSPVHPWIKRLFLTAGVTYKFEAWVRNICQSPACANVEQVSLRVDGTPLTGASVSNLAFTAGINGWVKICGTFTPCVSGLSKLDIEVKASTHGGNDVGIDDIVFGPAVNADFTYTHVACNKTITFTSSDNIGSHSTWKNVWDFGDNITSTGNNPLHAFGGPGTYVVTHSVTNDCGTATTTHLVTIESCCTCFGDDRDGINLVEKGKFPNSCAMNPLPYGSDFSAKPCNTSPVTGEFTEASGPSLPGRSYCQMTDHTPGGNTNFLIVDGFTLPAGPPEPRAWFQNGPSNNGAGWVIDPQHRSFCFKASFFNPEFAFPAQPSAKLVITACGVKYVVAKLDFLPYNDQCGWTTICGCWTAPFDCSHIEELAITLESNDCFLANDIGIDDIIFSPTTRPCEQSCGTETQHDNFGFQLSPEKLIIEDKALDDHFDLQQDERARKDKKIEIHPVPVNKGAALTLIYATQKEANLLIQIIDNQGKIVTSITQRLVPGSNEIILETQKLNPGSYIVKTSSGVDSQTKVIVVQ